MKSKFLNKNFQLAQMILQIQQNCWSRYNILNQTPNVSTTTYSIAGWDKMLGKKKRIFILAASYMYTIHTSTYNFISHKNVNGPLNLN